MYLKQLYIHGFKTFAEKTQITFNPGVTCIVGPNGSGKSNISDAILWVLGENNVRSLRGSAAQDVIFAGNERRRPLGMAEVSLTLDNSARILPLDFSEITVTRRLYRSGESEYSINKVNCRLKDIYELFLDTGVGRDAYSMINQGQIDQILSVRAEDRRAIFEEAAGIKKYRVRKREAERKLEHTQQNLLRVHDIIGEIEGQLAPLQRQAAAAKRYRELAVRLRDLENAWYGARLRRLNTEREGLAALVTELNGERRRLEEALAEAQEREKTVRAALQALDARAEALRQEESAALLRVAAAQAEKARAEERAAEVQRRLRALEQELGDLAARIEEQVRRSEAVARDEVELKREVDGLRTGLREAQATADGRARAHAAAAKELEQRRQAWVAQARRQAELKARAQGLEARVQSLAAERERTAAALQEAQAEHERLTAERESFQSAGAAGKARAEALAAELETLRAAARREEEALARARSAHDKAHREQQAHGARLQALSELGERGEGAAQGAKLLLDAVKRGQLKGRWSLLAEGLRVPAGLERAVEAALGIYADALLCDSPAEALPALAWLRSRKATALVLPETPQAAPAVLPESLGALVEGEETALAWARALLGRTVLVESLDVRTDGDADLWVTRAGEWRARTGAVSGGPLGAEGSAAATLARRREVESLRAGAPALQDAVAAAREVVTRAEAAVKAAQGALRERQSEAETVRLEQQAQTREADRRRADVERARQRLDRTKLDAARVEREHAAALESLRAAREQVGATPDAPEADGDGDLVRRQVEVGELEVQRREAERVVADLRVRMASQEQRLQSAAAASRRAVEGGATLDRQRSERLREQGTLTAEGEQRRLGFATLAEEVAAAEAVATRSREELARIAAERGERSRELDATHAGAQDLGARLRELMERAHRAEVELTALDTQRTHIGQQWLDAAVSGHSLEASQTEEIEEPLTLTPEGLLATWDPQAAELVLTSYSDPEAEIGRLRRQIRSLGAVNPDAVEQYAAARERYDFLTAQRTDLETAREQLEEAIRTIDAASRETFLQAFTEIAAAFDEMFKKLFGGGATELRLTDPSDVLETGVDIVVQPPGKKQQNLLLLSGGERALTAAAMLFALLKVRPSPFCVMDEVDAPLDEGNVGRFSSTLREFSDKTQFIVVTHNRGTMEGANTLYGVTMEERGVSKVLSCSLDDPLVEQAQAEGRHAAPVGASA